MKIHKETIASELELLINGVNSKEQTVEEIASYIRWRDKQLTLTDVSNQRGLLIALAKDFKENFISCDRIDPEKYVDDYLSNL
jgi:hypothetical protein